MHEGNRGNERGHEMHCGSGAIKSPMLLLAMRGESFTEKGAVDPHP
jgi:hypothetical protein